MTRLLRKEQKRTLKERLKWQKIKTIVIKDLSSLLYVRQAFVVLFHSRHRQANDFDR